LILKPKKLQLSKEIISLMFTEIFAGLLKGY